MIEIVEKAYTYAKEKHGETLDNDGQNFFEAHPAKVADLITIVAPTDYNLIAAAYLHDVVEDTNATYEDLIREFNQDVADLVMEVTHEGQKDSKGYYFPRLKTQRGIVLKFADRLSNLSRLENWDKERIAHYLKRSKFWRTEV